MTTHVLVTLQPADLVFFSGSSLIARGIQWATRGKREAKTYANHVAGLVRPGLALEARAKVQTTSVSDFVPPFEIWRNLAISDSDRQEVANAALRYHGRSYGILKVGAHLLDGLLSKLVGGSPYLARRLCRLDDYPICSWVWAYAYAHVLGEAGWFKAQPPNAVSPDDMHDHVSAEGSPWALVGGAA